MTDKIKEIMEWLNMDWLLPNNKKDQELAKNIITTNLKESIYCDCEEIDVVDCNDSHIKCGRKVKR